MNILISLVASYRRLAMQGWCGSSGSGSVGPHRRLRRTRLPPARSGQRRLAAKEEHRSDIRSTAHHHGPTLARASVVLKAWSMFRIREVDGHDDEIADTLADLHRLTFFGGASIPAFDRGQ